MSGISKAQQRYDNIGVGIVSPHVGLVTLESLQKAQQTLDFEVNVTVSEGEALGGSGGVKIGVLSLGVNGNTDAKNSSAATIRFTINFVPPLVQLKLNQESDQVEKA